MGLKVRFPCLVYGGWLLIPPIAFFKVSIDDHPLDIIQADDTEVLGPTGIHRVQLSLGERVRHAVSRILGCYSSTVDSMTS